MHAATRFRDRSDAGRQLAESLVELGLHDPVVLGLPRGGIVVAAEVAAALGTTFDVFVARKVGAPGHEEFGIGAVAEGWEDVVVSDLAPRIGLGAEEMETLAEVERSEVRRRVETYRGGRDLPGLAGRDVVLVDDGLATGVTAEAALRALRQHHPGRLVLAAPVCATDAAARMAALADDVVCLRTPHDFQAVGKWYDDFRQNSDAEVLALLEGVGR